MSGTALGMPSTRRRIRAALTLVLTGGLLCSGASLSHASADWQRPVALSDRVDGLASPPAVAIASNGRAAVAYRSKDGPLRVAVARPGVRLRRVRTLASPRQLGGYSVAVKRDQVAVAWMSGDALRFRALTTAGWSRTRTYEGWSRYASVLVRSDPRGGWVVAGQVNTSTERDAPAYRVRAMSLDDTGRLLGTVQDVGDGELTDLAVDDRGLAAVLIDPRSFPVSVAVSVRSHDGAFSPPTSLPQAADGDLVVGSKDIALGFTRVKRTCGEAGCNGAPLTVRIDASGPTAGPVGPPLSTPARATRPTSVIAGSRTALVFQIKRRPDPFRFLAPVYGTFLDANGRAGRLQRLSTSNASRPLIGALSDGRVLALWVEARKLNAALATHGRFRRTTVPAGPPPGPLSTSESDRELVTAGRHALLTWIHRGRLRASIRRY